MDTFINTEKFARMYFTKGAHKFSFLIEEMCCIFHFLILQNSISKQRTNVCLSDSKF